jgi:hypothetical protein
LDLADTAQSAGSALDERGNRAAVRLEGWRHAVTLVSASGTREGPGEALEQLATSVEPILRLRLAASENAPSGRARLSAFCVAVDWAIDRSAADEHSKIFTALVVESLDTAFTSQQLASTIRTRSGVLVVELGHETVGVLLEIDAADGLAAGAGALVSSLAGPASVIGGVSMIGPDLAAAAFDRAFGALELARRLGPGNTVVA